AGMRTILGGKSRSTLDKRASRTSHMLVFATRRKCYLFPLSEEVVIPYLTELDKAGKRSAVLDTSQTMNFLIHVLGVFFIFDIPKHPWVKGLVRKCEQERPPLRQSRVLTAKEVLALETLFIEGDLQPLDRYGLGCFLFMILSCSRVSDVSFLDSMVLDILESLEDPSNPGYLEVKTMHHKTERVKSKQGIPLYLVAPVRGKWSNERIRTSDAGLWLIKLLELALGGPPEPGLTSHGMKATLLSWCMKSGCDDLTLKILGHHSRPGQKTTECYGRDAMSAPLRTLVGVIQAVARGQFHPDATRSGHMALQGLVAAQPQGPTAPSDSGPLHGSAASRVSSAPDEAIHPSLEEDSAPGPTAGPDGSEDDVSDDESVPAEDLPAIGAQDSRANSFVPPLDWHEKGEVFENP
ncbi:unnamed protein product, partial [Symbiodinium necroappetens]